MISGGGSNMVKLVESMQGDHPARPCLVLSNDPDVDEEGASGSARGGDACYRFLRQSGDRALALAYEHARVAQVGPRILEKFVVVIV